MLAADNDQLRSYVLAHHAMETLDFHPISSRDMIRKFGYAEN